MGSSMALNRTLPVRKTGQALPGTLVVSLGYREVLALDGDRRGEQIVAAAAPVWVTQEGDPDDFVLEPGERFTIDRLGRVVLQGMRWNRR